MLLEHGYLKGDRYVEQPATSPTFKADEGEAAHEQKPPVKLVDVIVETVSKCSDEADDGVQLQVVAFFTVLPVLSNEQISLRVAFIPGDQGAPHDDHHQPLRSARGQPTAVRARLLPHPPDQQEPHQQDHSEGRPDPDHQRNPPANGDQGRRIGATATR
jgi:hypothetical protein